jgi:bacillithiol biosynthesis deacetylase BshB1
MGRRLMVVSPHPDDAELGMGGTIIKLKKQGHTVAIVDLTSGEPTPFGSEEKRKKETERATRVLKIDKRLNLRLENRYLFDSKETRLLLAGKIRTFRPDCVFCPHPADAHPDHVAAAAITKGARFYAKYSKLDLEGQPHYTPCLFFYFCSHLRKVHAFHFLVDTSGEFENKMETVNCYVSQFIDNPNNRAVFKYVETRDRYFGNLIRKQYAEPFLSEEALGVDDPVHFIL